MDKSKKIPKESILKKETEGSWSFHNFITNVQLMSFH